MKIVVEFKALVDGNIHKGLCVHTYKDLATGKFTERPLPQKAVCNVRSDMMGRDGSWVGYNEH